MIVCKPTTAYELNAWTTDFGAGNTTALGCTVVSMDESRTGAFHFAEVARASDDDAPTDKSRQARATPNATDQRRTSDTVPDALPRSGCRSTMRTLRPGVLVSYLRCRPAQENRR
jgi:hypothetical protein